MSVVPGRAPSAAGYHHFFSTHAMTTPQAEVVGVPKTLLP
ncbi:hypothetical protein SVIOM74S_01110 [Streptomyces violarus]